MSFVTIEMPGKRLRENPKALEKALNSVCAKTAHTLASILKRRVALRGRHEQGFAGYAGKNRRYVSPRYPTSGKKDKTGSYMFANSKAFHAKMGTKRGSFNVNKAGGMWKGLSVIVTSTRKSRIAFRGRSEGQGMVWMKPAPPEKQARSKAAKSALRAARKQGVNTNTKEWRAVKGQIIKSPPGPHWRVNAKGVKLAKPKKVSNALKAWTVMDKAGVNILAPTHREISGLTIAVTGATIDALESQFGPIPGLGIPKNEIARIMARAAEITRTAKDIR